MLAQLAGQYAIDMFIGSSLQIDADANSSTVTDGRLSGFGGAPNMGHDPRGRRHCTPAWLDLAHGDGASRRGRKIVVQMAQTFRAGGVPTFVETLDAVDVGKQAGMPLPPVMIYGDDVSHVVTEEGVAYLYKAASLADRRAALAAVAGVSPIGRRAEARRTEELRRDGLVAARVAEGLTDEPALDLVERGADRECQRARLDALDLVGEQGNGQAGVVENRGGASNGRDYGGGAGDLRKQASQGAVRGKWAAHGVHNSWSGCLSGCHNRG